MQCHFTDPVSLVRFLFHLLKICPEKYTKDKHHSEANGSCPRAANTWAKSQRFHILIPHCPNLRYLAGSSPSFHRVHYFGLIFVLSISSCRSPELTVLPASDTALSQGWLILSSSSVSPSSISAKSWSSGTACTYGEPGG